MSSRKHQSTTVRRLTVVGILLTAATLVGGFTGLLHAEGSGGHSGHGSHSEGAAWVNGAYDLDWKVELSPSVRSFLTLTGEGVIRRADQVDNDPALALTAAGSSPLIESDRGAALWPNCTQIQVTVQVDERIPDRNLALDATRDALKATSRLSGLDLVDGGQSTGDTNHLSAPALNGIQVVWVPADSAHFSGRELGSAEVWHIEDHRGQLTIIRARVLLSTDILANYHAGSAGEGRNVQTAVLHELTHAIGIGHSADEASFMHAEFGAQAQTTIADLAALAYAGSRSC